MGFITNNLHCLVLISLVLSYNFPNLFIVFHNLLLFPNYMMVLSKILVLSTSTCYFCSCSLTFIICVPFFPGPLGSTLFLCSYISSVTSLSFPPSVVFSPCHMNFPHPCLLFWFHLAICHFFVALLNHVGVLLNFSSASLLCQSLLCCIP